MAREVLEKIIGRAALDQRFRRNMMENPEKAFEEYNLTEEQLAAIKAIPRSALEKFAHELMGSIGKHLRSYAS